MTSTKLKLLLVVSLVIGGCGTTQDEAYDALSKEMDAVLFPGEERSSGEAWLRLNSKNELEIFQSIDDDPQTAEKAVVLALDGMENLPREDQLGYTDIFITQDSKFVMIHASSDNSLYLLGLNEENDHEQIKLLKSNSRIRAAIKMELFGHGISRLSGSWKRNDSQFGVVNSSLRPDYISADPYSGGGWGSCTSGGPGSSACSITEWPGVGCSITCGSGYYACCNSSTTKCYCTK